MTTGKLAFQRTKVAAEHTPAGTLPALVSPEGATSANKLVAPKLARMRKRRRDN